MEIDDIIDFLGKSQTKYHFVSYTKSLLSKRKFLEVDHSQLGSNDIPTKAFLVINRTTIVAYELGTIDKTLIFTSSLDGKALNIIDSNNENEKGLIQCSINNEESNINKNSEVWDSFDYLFAGEIMIKENSRLKTYLFKSDKSIGFVQNNNAFISLSEKSINEYLENCLNISIQESDLIEKKLFLVPDTQSTNNNDNIFIGAYGSIISLSNFSSFGISYMILKAFISSLGKSTFNKFIIISSNESNITASELSSYINTILSKNNTSVNADTFNFNIGGIESNWSSHFTSPIKSTFLSKGIVMQNYQKYDIILNRLAKFGIPIHFANDHDVDYSISQNQIILNDGNLPLKISLPMFNYKQITETVSISDVYNLYNSLYEIFMI